jgi:hypothetical protein
MERLQRDLSAMVSHINGLLSAHGEPTSTQLAEKTRQMSEAIEKGAAGLPLRIQKACVDSFAAMGWDTKRKKIVDPEKFNSAGLVLALTSILEATRTFAAAPPINPTPEELSDISLACSRLWDLDTNRLVPGQDYAINLQSGKNFHEEGDVASDPLFSFVDESVFLKPTYRNFFVLLDNYSAAQGVAEVVTNEELRENSNFLDSILATPVMQYCHKYLLAAGKVTAKTTADFKNVLNQVWFELYGRLGRNDSSGFEVSWFSGIYE